MKRESLRAAVRRWWKEINLRQQFKGEHKYGTYRPAQDFRDNLVERMKEQVDAPAYLRMEEEKIWFIALARADGEHPVPRWKVRVLVAALHALAEIDRWWFMPTVWLLRFRDRMLAGGEG